MAKEKAAAPKVEAKEGDKPETGFFPAFDFKKRPKMVNGKQGQELRLRSIKDGSVFALFSDGYDKEGRPNQAQAQLIRTVSLKTKVGDRDVPVYYLDEGSAPIAIPLGKGLPRYELPFITPELLKVIEANQAARESVKSGQQAHVDANLKPPAKDGE